MLPELILTASGKQSKQCIVRKLRGDEYACFIRLLLYLYVYVRGCGLLGIGLMGSWSWTLPRRRANWSSSEGSLPDLTAPRRPGPACSSPLEPVWPYYMIGKAESPLGWFTSLSSLKPRPSGLLLLQLSIVSSHEQHGT